MVLSRGFKLMAAGGLAGFFGSIAISRLIESLLLHVRSTDPLTFASVASLMLGTIAVLIPVRRASKVDPIIALREE
jgi:ABC-type antimicrobial peptide transport system permease subunit